MRAFYGLGSRLLPGRGPRRGGERRARRRHPGGVVGVRAFVTGGARSGKSALAERLAGELGGGKVLYAATAVIAGDPDLARRVRLHRERRPEAWGTMEAGDLGEVVRAAELWGAVLLDSLTLWVSARLFADGEAATLEAFDRFLEGAKRLPTPFVLVSDEVGSGVVPGREAGRNFRDTLGLVNQRAAAAAQEAHLCVAGIGVRIK